ncbi:MAG: 8-oxoguanine DNA glycosylase [Clostridia bacterium]|nr:8-oxoguanine DNA glycosylase [Clostridia bacterium]
MKKIIFNSEYFNILDTLDCGQTFRFKPFDKGFIVLSKDRCAYLYAEEKQTVIECLAQDEEYFYNYFDLSRDYAKICESAERENIPILTSAVSCGKGIRILNQDKEEMLFSFIISQNNNIPRIKGIIDRLCHSLGEKREFLGQEYFTFPTAVKMAEKDLVFYESIGLGYRAKYIKNLADNIANGLDVEKFNDLTTKELKQKLLSIFGVGPKVADCVALFGFHRSDSFPVDTWIEKVYVEDLKGTIKDRAKIADYLVDRFKENSGYYQQYLFYHKRISQK